ncbi:glucosaminidase domain-containing protein [uncultured Prevotella sp.]|uniref:glucosaminidase domain-containing protein n=1 Tax=uncultured Prevotella sp. TaxID=159272 RepID=UPI0026277B4D|nr:glucosaminidase domain-containing protein [uncultured Prevotella sp.]
MKKYIILLVMSFVACTGVLAQMKWNQRYQTYINQYRDLAIEQMLKFKIPASITLAQGLLESGAGYSELATKGNNHFGIKCHGWTGRKTYHDDDEAQECFRAYNNVYESYEDHSLLLSRQPRYRSLFSLDGDDYKGWAHGLKKCGYATSPTYAQKLIGIIELYKLQQYDKAKKYDRFMESRAYKDSPSAKGGIQHPIHRYNKNYYIVVKQGDTFRSLGKELGLSYRKIAKYNERNKRDKLVVGETIYLKKKQKKADKTYKNRPHMVKPGESMYSIAQYYGMRVKSLYKKNGLSPDYVPKVGDKLRVR